MAAILREVLDERISVPELIKWITNRCPDQTPEAFNDLKELRKDFVLFFVNYLRDQTQHLLLSSRSACQSPSKTPTNLKFNKPNFSHRQDTTNVGSTKRVQLFAASPTPDDKSKQSTPKDLSSIFTSPNVSIGSPMSFRMNSASRKESINRISPICESSARTKHTSHNTPDSQRSRQKHSLAEFLFSPELDNRRRRSPHAGSFPLERDPQVDLSPSPQTYRRSSGKKKSGSSSEKTRRIIPTCVSSPPVFSLSNLDDFPPVGGTKDKDSSRSHEKDAFCPPRRIKPTPITQEGKRPVCGAFSSAAASTVTASPLTVTQKAVFVTPQENMCITLEQERRLLREERAKRLDGSSSNTDLPVIVTPKKTTEKPSTVTPKKLNLDRPNSVSEVITADASEVTHSDKLDVLSDLYSSLLDENLLPNLIVELYFTIQLLTVRIVDGDLYQDTGQDAEDVSYFLSVHNAVYFAVRVLQRQTRLLSLLDKGTLRLLTDNCRIMHFNSELREMFKKVYEKTKETVSNLFTQPSIGNVSFQADTDNRNNFPNDKSFQIFKKQRDLFYELIRTWESKHMSPTWSMAEALGQKIQALIGYRTELANYIHFARLFQSQLIHMCKGDSSVNTDNSEDQIELLSHLKQTNPDKFKKLQERFITPSRFLGPSPPPSFPGAQEFFRDFIMIACNHVFNQHLMNSFASKLKELNKFEIPKQDSENTDTVDEERKEMFKFSMLTLRLLGKFLGFVTFLPYQTPERLPDCMQTEYLAVRNKMLPAVDVVDCLLDSATRGTSVLCVPWIVDFVSMMDLTAPLIDYYQKLLMLLLRMHKFAGRRFQASGGTSLGHLLILLLLGWLFDLHIIPEGLFFSASSGVNTLDVKENTVIYGLVDLQLLYTCCPYIGEVKSLLLDFTIGANSKNATIRKIKPLTTTTKAAESISHKQIQHQLEENFFHNHPASLRRCVEFVADRVASNYVKKYRAHTLPKLQSDGIAQITELMKTAPTASTDSRAKEKMLQKVDILSTSLRDKGYKTAVDQMTSYCAENSAAILPLLLPDETSDQVNMAASQIANRIAQEKILTWINAHITLNFFKKDLGTEFEKLWRQLLFSKSSSPVKKVVCATTDIVGEQTGCSVHAAHPSPSMPVPCSHDPELPSPSDLLNHIKDLLKSIILGTHQPNEAEIQTTLTQLSEVLMHREDLLPTMFRVMSKVTVEMAVILIALYPACYSTAIHTSLLNLWARQFISVVNMTHILSAKNVLMINRSLNQKESWSKYQMLLGDVSKCGLVSIATMEQQSFQVAQLISRQETVENIARCISSMVLQYEGQPPSGHVGHQLLEVMEWLTALSNQENDAEPLECVQHCVQKLRDWLSPKDSPSSVTTLSCDNEASVYNTAEESSSLSLEEEGDANGSSQYTSVFNKSRTSNMEKVTKGQQQQESETKADFVEEFSNIVVVNHTKSSSLKEQSNDPDDQNGKCVNKNGTASKDLLEGNKENEEHVLKNETVNSLNSMTTNSLFPESNCSDNFVKEDINQNYDDR